MQITRCRFLLGAIVVNLAMCVLMLGCDNGPVNQADQSPETKTARKLSYQLLKSGKSEPVLNTPYWNKVKSGTLIVSFTPDSPPFCVGKKETKGFNYALAEIISRTLGIKLQCKILKLHEQIPSLLKGEIDIIMAPLTRTAKRGVKVAFTKPYYHVTQGVLLRRGYLFIPKENAIERQFIGKKLENFFHLRYLKNLSIAVKQGSSNETLCRWMLPETTKIKTCRTNEEAVAALLAKESIAMVADHTYINVWLAMHPEHHLDVSAVTGTSTQDGLAMAIRKEDADFLAWLNLLIDEISGNGMLENLKNNYIDDLSWIAADKE